MTSSAIPPAYDHVVIVIEENEQYQAIIGSSGAPYINYLAANGVSFRNMHAIVHPSQPNYLEFFSGSNQGVVDDWSFGTKFTTPNLGASLIAAGRTFAAYSESLPAEGDITSEDVNGYAKRHCPWVAWMPATEPLGANQLPRNLHKQFTAFPKDFSQLPTVSFVIPNNFNNMHSASISTADTWLKNNLGTYAEWAKTNNSLLIVTWDEDSFQQANLIPTIFYGANLQPWQNNGAWSLHNLLRTIEDMYGLPHAGRAAAVPPITGSFPEEPPVITKVFSSATPGSASVVDTMLVSQSPTTTFGTATVLRCISTTFQPLIKFPGIFGTTPTAIPSNSTIVSAKLIATTANDTLSPATRDIEVHRMLIPWSDSSTYSSFTNGVQLDNVEASTLSDFTAVPSWQATAAVFDVTPSILAFQSGAPNHGWVLKGLDDWYFHSSDNSTFRPALEISYVGDLVGFDAPRFVVAPGGTEARVTVHRFGPGTGPLSVSYATGDNTAFAGSDYTSVSGSFNWPDGDTAPRTIVIPITADTSVEGVEKFRVILSNLTGQAGFDNFSTADVVIDKKAYDLWRNRWFSSSPDGPNTLPEANPDGDRASNLEEYWYGLNPNTRDAGVGWKAAYSGLLNDRLTITFRKGKMATDATYTVQVSEDLVTWVDGSRYSASGSTPDTPITEEAARYDFPEYELITVESKTTTAAGQLFMRLRVTPDP